MVAVVVTLTTIPARAHLLWPVLDSLLHKQSAPPAAVIVNLPRAYNAGLGSVDVVPAWRSRQGVRLIVNRDCADVGPGTKLVGAAALLRSFRDALVVYLDDDHVPNAFFVNAHATAHRRARMPAVYCGRGEVVESVEPFRRTIHNQWDPAVQVNVPSGVGSVSVMLRHLNIEKLAAQVTGASPTTRMADDIIFADWFARRNLAVFTLGVPWLMEMQAHSVDEWALHKTLRKDCAVQPDARYAVACAELGYRPSFPQRARAATVSVGRRRVKMWKGNQ